MSPHHKTIFITGSGSGIGRDATIALAGRGHTVIASTHTQSDADRLNDLATEENLPITAIVLDVTDAEDRKKVLDYDIDVLINNAGIGETGSLAEIDMDKVRHNFEVNVFGPFELAQLALKSMLKRQKGTIIFVSSLFGRVTGPFFGPYIMTKFAISSGAETLRKELAQITDKVHIAVVEPGAYHTGFNQEMMATKYTWMDERSYFDSIKDKIKNDEEKQFALTEVKSTQSIVNQIVKAAESDKPRLRYVAPWWQGLAVQVARIFGA